METCIHIKNLCYQIGGKQILKDISANFENNALNVIIGANGSGKTTLLRLIAGFLKPSSGEIFYGSESIHSFNVKEQAKMRAYMSQKFSPEFDFTALDAVVQSRICYNKFAVFDLSEDLEKARKALDLCNALQFENQGITSLSGGELQRVMLARCIAQGSPIIMLDEPLTHLDPKSAVSIIQIAQKLVKEQNKTVIAVLHDINFAYNFADKVFILKDGELIGHGTAIDTINSDSMKKAFDINISFATCISGKKLVNVEF